VTRVVDCVGLRVLGHLRSGREHHRFSVLSIVAGILLQVGWERPMTRACERPHNRPLSSTSIRWPDG
jgi:hypothetical protein